MTAELEAHITAGLRFDPRDAQALLDLARRAELLEKPGPREFYAKAAIAAELGEPLIIRAASIDDLQQQASVYIREGIRPPAIDTLTA